MKTVLFSFLFFLGTLTQVIAQTPFASWHFDEMSGMKVAESIGNTDFDLINDALLPERVAGVSGMALRLNGYSQWVEGALGQPLPSGNMSLTGWFALESYPVSNAAFWATETYGASEGVVIGVDKYGRVSVGVNTNQSISLAVSSVTLPRFEWFHLAATINTTTQQLEVFLNGQQIILKSLQAGSISWPQNQSLLLGCHPNRDSVGRYPVCLVNGILDEMDIFDQALSATEVNALYTSVTPANLPELAIPKSRFAGDHHRPIYHPMPAAAWANEAHGLIYHAGWYHIYYQKNANGPYWSNINWGHLRSRDLVSWEHMQPVLAPSPNAHDLWGIWSGHTVINQGVPTIVYTGVDGAKASIGIATSDDSMNQFVKHPMNPVVTTAPSHIPNNDFRDPFLWYDGTQWNMIIGSGNSGSNPGGMLFMYQSPDLVTWSFKNKFHSGRDELDQAGYFWEMPFFTQIDSQWVLGVNSVPLPGRPAQLLYWTGTQSGTQFVPDETKPKLVEVSNWLLAPSVMTDTTGETVAIAIIPDLLPADEQHKNGWANAFSLPRIWNIDANKTLLQTPHPSLKKLRGTHYHWDSLYIDTNSQNAIGSLRGLHYEMKATIQRGTGSRVGFVVGRAPNGSEQTKIYYNPGVGIGVVDLIQSSTNPRAPIVTAEGKVEFGFLEPFDIHVFIDGSMIEVFTNDGRSFAARFYPEDPNSDELDIFVEGGDATFLSLDIWEMRAMDDPKLSLDPREALPMLEVAVYPNPFHTETKGQFFLDQRGEAVIRILDLKGQVVKTLPLGMLPAGEHGFSWDGRNAFGEAMPDQVFFLQLNIDGQTRGTAKLVKQ